MLDYRLIEAFAAVLSEGRFERAGQKLGLTQSAISHRIHQLEELVGTLLILREEDPKATPAGERLLRHFLQVQALEQELREDWGVEGSSQLDNKTNFTTLRIAVNEDSLSTWFLTAILPFFEKKNILIDLYLDDQDQTIKFLQSGTVAACISSQKRNISGCISKRLGQMEYRLCASRFFSDKWFKEGFTKDAVKDAPVIHYGRTDRLQLDALQRCFGSYSPPPAHYIPSVEQIFDMVLSGCGYSMIPLFQGQLDLDNGSLVELDPRGRVTIELYWHRWGLETKIMNTFEKDMFEKARTLFQTERP